MAAVVYILCCLASLACAVLLLKSFRQNHVRLLLWSGLCFLGMAFNNAVLFVDRIVFPETDLYVMRTLPVLIGLLLLIYGFIWEGE